ncbi:hypothetical protein BaRGS_00012464 [Batillaria attramentaria]|uniref:Uncharacterized protein n=1 Tax=Batillaria attramentaria TaxID=370345 RepID=A0ABD0LAZ4_9CAEN
MREIWTFLDRERCLVSARSFVYWNSDRSNGRVEGVCFTGRVVEKDRVGERGCSETERADEIRQSRKGLSHSLGTKVNGRRRQKEV